ncbi:MAG: hypothetical protein US83_C0011G0045 [Candidatus Falkowbacteria bacterium GW2011_GWC2_38_22]|uniref:Helix-turn-helix domain-containing protein n=1 Tax=Candidatus Falkowbacteria bacterium GW2011_GWE1_38_31 TaxID=1618638 RepID=A0A0G0JT51_9BACT|nr:MAG: hypothetical protein US73_C0009G0045 [Candidatus Falkowbacteria bacterium GW2011_GWF2_38_1205]KKQ60927.1 MAG: hypothetical protein US83_C0011G0045 [Candidatus Falkowbacteria bacterium GW2011_GWC2_38_22]KKQ63045.1 MAG: hypothetical protein US84_C0009G0045 [Candidatus Falkowbacteria bacterium GW2011_GWF1_38_22]KKQ65067.1 MAG: hypothetical protein US87_C0009G0045 [Candidatus Falkowbacteria bacterium GW2011_GWE2_38_254]KKQ69842.1 MAG: hypothetical protein US91_C0009G0045 [Candidatus Falkowb
MTTDFTTIQKFYSIKEIAKIFGISNVTIYRLVEARKIPFYKIKGCIRFSHGDVIDYLEQNRLESVD